MNDVHVATIHNEKYSENKSIIPSLSSDVDALYDPNALKFVPMDGYRSCYLVQKAWPSLCFRGDLHSWTIKLRVKYVSSMLT